MSPRFPVRRAVAAVAGGAVVAGGLMVAGPTPVAHAAPVNAEAEAAAGWLADQLDEDGLFTYLDWQGQSTTDIGTTIDFGLSLLETDPDAPQLNTALTGVQAVLADYVGTPEVTNTGGLAKAAALYQAADFDIEDIDGLDLLTSLEGVIQADGQLGGSKDVYGQSWAVQVLREASSPKTADATDKLIEQACDDGGWGYDDFQTGDCVSVPDGTAYAVLALLPQQDDPDVAAAIDDGIAWLDGQQRADGGFGDWGDNANGTTSEANGSGLAAWALGEAGETAKAEAAATWVADHQVTAVPAACGATPLAGETGALAYDDKNIRDAIKDGITATDQQTWVIAGAQALAGLAYLPTRPATTGSLTAPTGYVDAGQPATVQVGGLRPGQTACLTGVGATQWFVGQGSTTFLVPGGTGDHTLTLSYAGGSATATLKALDAKKLEVKVKGKLKAKKKATIKVKGLAAGETVTVKVGKKKASGVANAKGVAKVKVKVKKKGKAKVKVTGQFPDRTGKATTRVV
ncbi:prenyltransferase/squalene oxidase repeat-containing protein [Nocardioides humi]|uniref:Prenyltransferase and squalene oxidase repeat-containing protein n=1 Tax=Nocardioides humi TaxID=449461 RepID=A0ABN2AP91_9ACTN|nr:prenyltransferase/squalene oxidase repeat-containing protein [Nocardioides humi]